MKQVIKDLWISCTKRRSWNQFPSWKNYLRSNVVGGYIGWVGFGNLGDEILFQTFQAIFPTSSLLLYGNSKCRRYNPHSYPYPAEVNVYRLLRKRRLFDFVLLGGGTLLYDPWYLEIMEAAVASDVPVIVFGTGVRENEYIQRHHKHTDLAKNTAAWIAALKRTEVICVRGPLSQRELQKDGLLDVTVCGDPAISACNIRPRRSANRKRIGISIGGEDSLTHGSQLEIDTQAMQTAKELERNGWAVELLPMNRGDFERQRKLIESYGLNASLWTKFESNSQTLERIETYDVLVGQRLHSLILAGSCGIPIVSLTHSRKNEDFMESMEMGKFSLRADSFSKRPLSLTLQEVEESYEEISAQLCDKARHYQRVQKQLAEKVHALALSRG